MKCGFSGSAPTHPSPLDSQATVGSGWSVLEPGHELHPAGQPAVVWLGSRRDDRLEVSGESGERLFDLETKCHQSNGHNGLGTGSSDTLIV